MIIDLAAIKFYADEHPSVQTIETPSSVVAEWAASGLDKGWVEANTLSFASGFNELLAAITDKYSRMPSEGATSTTIARRAEALHNYKGAVTVIGGTGSVQVKPIVRIVGVPKYMGLPGCDGDASLPTIPKGRDLELYNLRLKRMGKPPVRFITSYWDAVLADRGPIGLDEGTKKTCLSIAVGLPAISLKGIFMACLPQTETLRPEIAQFVQENRAIIIMFDSDEKQKTIENVKAAIQRIGRAIGKRSTRFTSHDGSIGKGIDDFMMASEGTPYDAMTKILESARPVTEIVRDEMREAVSNPKPSRYVAEVSSGKYLGDLVFAPGFLAIDGTMGSGKTKSLTDLIRLNGENGGLSIYTAPLNSIGRQAAKMAGIYHMHDAQAMGPSLMAGFIRQDGGVALCPQSMWKMLKSGVSQDCNLFIIDEASATIEAILDGGGYGSTAARVLEEIAIVARGVLARGGMVIVAQDGLSDASLDLIRSISPESNFRKVSHAGNGASWDVANYTNKAAFIESFSLALSHADEQPIVFVTSSQISAEMAESMALRFAPGIEVHRIDSKTNRDGFYKGFFEDPDRWLPESKVKVLICSPSVKSGVSIEGGVEATGSYFKKVFGLFESGDTDTHKQLLARIRPGIERHIYCASHINVGRSGGRDAAKKARERAEMMFDRALKVARTIDPNRQTLDADTALRISDAALTASIELQRDLKTSGAVARDSLVATLVQRGHSVAVMTQKAQSEASMIAWKDSKLEIQDRDAAQISSARDLTAAEYKDLSKKDCSLSDSIAVEKYKLNKALGGKVILTPEVVTALLYRCLDKQGGYLRSAKVAAATLDFAVNGADAVIVAKDAAANAHILGGSVRMINQVKSNFVEAAILSRLGILDLYKKYAISGAFFNPESEDMVDLEARATEISDHISEVFSFTAAGKRGTEIFKMCLRRLHLEKSMIKEGMDHGVTVDRVNVYSIDPSNEAAGYWDVVTACCQGDIDWLEDFRKSQSEIVLKNEELESELALEVAKREGLEWETPEDAEDDSEAYEYVFAYEPDE